MYLFERQRFKCTTHKSCRRRTEKDRMDGTQRMKRKAAIYEHMCYFIHRYDDVCASRTGRTHDNVHFIEGEIEIRTSVQFCAVKRDTIALGFSLTRIKYALDLLWHKV